MHTLELFLKSKDTWFLLLYLLQTVEFEATTLIHVATMFSSFQIMSLRMYSYFRLHKGIIFFPADSKIRNLQKWLRMAQL